MAARLEPRPVRLDWPIVAGDDESITFVIVGIDTSGRTYSCHLRDRPSSPTTAAVAAVTAVLVAGNTEVTVSLTDAQTRALAGVGRLFYWDLQEDAGGTMSTLIGGSVHVALDVTR